ncbi:sigma-70 family RNA polymerase sigma factor [Lentisphaera profundi]|uniref:Sigma-70 family RNA polymerase sigma factor n=1 Tax=Lentisphaera profundi TaxID=1658616 RepID=A0ABY7VWN1_9BACT|nr:sigma-70 family RNA polymerase sigma factor [Lentisphaera profundi]WDE97600.1 sigma-70 family RNA polymerase sigma factor [Lentisphaera profundi]
MSKWNTRHTLIQRAQSQRDNETWEEFVQAYEKFIFYMLHQMKIPQVMIDDLAQEILLNLWTKINNYSKEKGKFRPWLTRVIRNSTSDFIKKDLRYNKRQETLFSLQQNLAQVSETDFEKIIDREWRTYMIELTLNDIEGQVSKTAIEVFRLSMKEVPVEKIAAQMNISKNSVYTLKNRVKDQFTSRLRYYRNELEF